MSDLVSDLGIAKMHHRQEFEYYYKYCKMAPVCVACHLALQALCVFVLFVSLAVQNVELQQNSKVSFACQF